MNYCCDKCDYEEYVTGYHVSIKPIHTGTNYLDTTYYKDTYWGWEKKERKREENFHNEPNELLFPESKIEYRWCFNCQGVRSIFTGEPKTYTVYKNPLSEGWMEGFYYDENGYCRDKEMNYNTEYSFFHHYDDIINHFDLLLYKTHKTLNDYNKILSEHIKSSFYLKLLKFKKNKELKFNIKNIKNKILLINSLIFDLNNKKIKFKESLHHSTKLNLESIKFWKNHNPKPKCLYCGDTNVSKKSLSDEKHDCGGNLGNEREIRGVHRMEQRDFCISNYLHVRYDENGNSIKYNWRGGKLKKEDVHVF